MTPRCAPPRCFGRASRAAALVAALLAGAAAGAQETAPDPQWGAWISEVPTVDLSGRWVFDPEISDPMIEEWRGRRIEYRVRQSPATIVLEFLPEQGRGNTQVYRWDGSIAAFERGGRQVRERARWDNGGRTLRIEGRHWAPGDDTVERYEFIYRLESSSVLAFVQQDEFGQTVWRFRRVDRGIDQERGGTAGSGSSIRRRWAAPSTSSTQSVPSGAAAMARPRNASMTEPW